MSMRSFFRRSRKRRKARRSNRGCASRRLRFETIENRRLLSFTPGATYSVGETVSYALVTADFNNDGHLDLATPNRSVDGSVSVLLGDGQGGFGSATLFAVGGYPWSVAVGDFNEDGKLDIATGTMGDYTGNVLPDISVLIGKGDGTFETVKSVPTVWAPKSVAVGDFNADGKLDLGVGSSDFSYYSYISVNLGDGAGNFGAPVGSELIDGIMQSATAADLNGDGADDLVVADGQRGSGIHIYLGGNLSGYLQPSDVLIYGRTVEDTAVGDVNGDGDLDIVAANASGGYGVSVLLGDGQGGFGAVQSFAAGFHPGATVALGDFTGDGQIDLATWWGILRGNGDGTFSAPEIISSAGYGAVAGDFNGDGWLDIVSRDYNSVSVRLNDGDWGQLLGDYNGSGRVDTADYVVWRKSLGGNITRHTGADGSGNGVVDQDDYNVWRAHFSQTLPPAISVSDATVIEGNTGTVNATFTLSLSQASAVDVTVQYGTVNITAAAGLDYTAASGTVTIPAGQTSRTFAVAVLGDHSVEYTWSEALGVYVSAETFAVYLSAPTNATILDGQGLCTILDDEPRISIDDVSKSEGMGGKTLFTFTVTLSTAYDQPVTMSYRTVAATATTFDNDYIAKTGTLTFAPGETTKTITIEVKGDNKNETNETFYLDLFDSSSNSLFTKFRGIGTIWNDD